MSLVTMARKVKAQQGVSKKGFSLNGTYKESGAPRSTVKTSLTSRRNRYNTAVCFGGQEGIQCERVWDGKKEVPKDGGISMAGGDAIRASEYIDRLRYTVGRCKNLLFKTDKVGADVKVLFDTETNNYVIRSNEKNYQVKWYNSTGAIKAFADIEDGNAVIKSISVTGRRTTTIESKVTQDTPTTYVNTAQATAGIYQESPTTGAQKFGDDEQNTLFEVLDQGKEFYIKIQYTDVATLKNNLTNFTDINGDDILKVDWDDAIDGGSPSNFLIGRTVNINGTDYLQKNLRHFTLKTLSFENPERSIYEPVGCDTLSDGSGLGGTAGADDRGYYGRGRCKVTWVNKDPAFEPKGYDGPGGYLDMIKMPHDDKSNYCGN
jgi:hypothetical protein